MFTEFTPLPAKLRNLTMTMWQPHCYHIVITITSSQLYFASQLSFLHLFDSMRCAMFLPLLLAVIPFVVSAPSHPLISLTHRSNHPVVAVAPTGNNSMASGDIVATAWYPGWLGDQSPPEKISWSKYTLMSFAFAFVACH